MRKIQIIALLLATLGGSVFAQTPSGAYSSPATGGGLTQVASLPTVCSLGILDQLTVAPYAPYWCPQTNTVLDLRGFGKAAVYAEDFGMKGGVTKGCAATYNGTAVVTTGTNDPPFLSNAVGNIVVGTGVACAGNGGAPSGSVLVSASCPPTCQTILSVDNAHQIHLSSAATGSAGNGTSCCYIAWGPQDDGPALASAFTYAVATCPFDLELPAGGFFIGQFPQTTTSLCGYNAGSSISIPSGIIQGRGPNSTIFYPLPALTMASCTGAWCFFGFPTGVQGINLSNFQVDGLGINTVTGGTGKTFLMSTVSGYMHDIILYQYGFNTTITPIVCSGVAGSESVIANVIDYNFGGGGFNLGPFCYTNNFYYFSAAGSIITDASGPVHTRDSDINGAIYVTGATGYYSTKDTFAGGIYPNATNMLIYMDGDILGGSTTYTLSMGCSGCAVHAHDTAITGGSTNSIGQGVAGAKFWDEGGNTIGATPSWTNIQLFGSNSITGTAQVNTNWSVPAGSGAGQWGTSPSVACPGTLFAQAGDSHTESCTITVGSGTVGANPIVTIAFPTAFWLPPSCEGKMTSGTATLANFTVGVPSATSVALTYQGTPAASSTVGLVVICGP